jgi:hypothetical protein
MEFVMGQITRECRDEEDWWVVVHQTVELMAFETLWQAHEWRRTTPVFAQYEAETGVQYYMQEEQVWYVRGAGSRGWREAADQRGVEQQVRASTEAYQRRMQALGARGKP